MPPRLASLNGELLQYHMILRETQILHSDNGTTVVMEGFTRNRTFSAIGNLTQVINALHPNYNYTVLIAAETAVGMSPYSPAVTVKTPEDSK